MINTRRINQLKEEAERDQMKLSRTQAHWRQMELLNPQPPVSAADVPDVCANRAALPPIDERYYWRGHYTPRTPASCFQSVRELDEALAANQPIMAGQTLRARNCTREALDAQDAVNKKFRDARKRAARRYSKK